MASFDNFRQDLRHGLRAMRRDAAFCAVAVLILGLGIGANTAIFSVANTLLFRPLPFRDPQRLVWIANTGSTGLSGATTRVSNYRDWRTMNRSFEDLTAYFAFSDYGSYNLLESGEPERLAGYGVAQNFFGLLGVQPDVGPRVRRRGMRSGTGARPPSSPTACGSAASAAIPKVIGRSITLNDQPTTIVGVMPQEFDFASVFVPGSKVDLFVPFSITDETDRWGNTLAVIGRLKPGSTVAQARADFEVLIPQITAGAPGTRHTLGRAPDGLAGPGERAVPPGPGGAAVRGGSGPADRLRQSFEPAAGACGVAAQRGVGARSAGRDARAVDPPVAHREHAAGVRRRRSGTRAGVGGHARAGRTCTA